MISRDHYAHPVDISIMEKIFSAHVSASLAETVIDNDLDAVYDYTLENSYACLPRNDPAWSYIEEGYELFGGSPIHAVYLTREYEYDVVCKGYNHPVVLVPYTLLRRADQEIIRARMLSTAATIAMEHHRLEFMLWLLETMGGSIPLPVIPDMFRGSLYEWYRCRRYTTDRAVYLATGELSLALRNILYGEIPFEMLNSFAFDGKNDTFLAQVRELEAAGGLSGAASKLIGIFQKESWLTSRYRELITFSQGRKGGAIHA